MVIGRGPPLPPPWWGFIKTTASRGHGLPKCVPWRVERCPRVEILSATQVREIVQRHRPGENIQHRSPAKSSSSAVPENLLAPQAPTICQRRRPGKFCSAAGPGNFSRNVLCGGSKGTLWREIVQRHRPGEIIQHRSPGESSSAAGPEKLPAPQSRKFLTKRTKQNKTKPNTTKQNKTSAAGPEDLSAPQARGFLQRRRSGKFQ